MYEFVDFYELIHLQSTAGPDEIKSAITGTRNEWRQRQNHPNLAKRSEAEHKMAQLAECEKVLLDAALRSEFDKSYSDKKQQRTSRDEEKSSQQSGKSVEKKLEIAFGYLEAGKWDFAFRKAEEITNSSQDIAEAWQIRGIAAQMMQKYEEALYSLNEGLRIDPQAPETYELLADVYADTGDDQRAVSNAERAFNVMPTSERKANLAFYQVKSGDFQTGFRNLNAALLEDGENKKLLDTEARIVSAALLKQVSYNRNTQAHLITNTTQLRVAKAALARLKSLIVRKGGDVESISGEHEWLDDFIKSQSKIRWRVGRTWVYLIPVALYFLGIIQPVFGPFTSLISLLWPFIAAVYWFRHFTPQYKLNAKSVDPATRRSGIQNGEKGFM